MLQLESKLQHKVKEFNLKPESSVLVKNSTIELSADHKMKPQYLELIVVIWCLRGGTFILAELDRSVWQNKVAAFRVIPYLTRKKISYNKEVKDLLDALEESVKTLEEKINTRDLDEISETE